MTRTNGLKEFYVLVGMLNAVVALMFFAVNFRPLPPPITANVVVARAVSVPEEIPPTVGTPTRIVLPSLSIDLPVGIGSYDPASGNWTVDTTKAYYADISMPINNSNGTTLIYGHAQTPVFASLPQITPQSEAKVYTDTGYLFTYSFQSMKEVEPTDTAVFRADGPPTLTLQTCTGAWDAYRALFSFQLQGVEKV